MKQPDPEFELKLLRDVLEQAGDAEGSLDKQIRMRKLLLTIGSVLLTAAFVLAFGSSLYAALIAAVAAVGGIATGFAVYLKFTQDQWPITVRYIDISSIEERIGELESR